MWSSYIRFLRPLPPHKISNNILIYLASYRILAPPLPVIKIVKYCVVTYKGVVKSWRRVKIKYK